MGTKIHLSIILYSGMICCLLHCYIAISFWGIWYMLVSWSSWKAGLSVALTGGYSARVYRSYLLFLLRF